MNKITAGQLIIINRKVTGDTEHISDRAKNDVDEIIRIIYEQDEMFFYKYKGIVTKAVKLGSLISKTRPFRSGNDKTAVISALTLLELNGVKLKDYEEKIEELVDIFKKGSLEDGCDWIDLHKTDTNNLEAF